MFVDKSSGRSQSASVLAEQKEPVTPPAAADAEQARSTAAQLEFQYSAHSLTYLDFLDGIHCIDSGLRRHVGRENESSGQWHLTPLSNKQYFRVLPRLLGDAYPSQLAHWHENEDPQPQRWRQGGASTEAAQLAAKPSNANAETSPLLDDGRGEDEDDELAGAEDPGSSWKTPADPDETMTLNSFVYLALIACASFGICIAVTGTATWIASGVKQAASSIAHPFDGHAQFVSVALMMLFHATLATCSYLVVSLFGEGFSVGSGIPELKCALQGNYHTKLFSFRTLLSKAVGLSLSLASGLSIGRLGPFVHFATVVASQTGKLKFLFPWLARSPKKRIQAMVAACAIGVSATTGSIVGATFLSIELTGLYFYTHWFPVCLWAALSGYMMGALFLGVDEMAYFPSSPQPLTHDLLFLHTFYFAVFGVFCGLVGVCIITVKQYATNWIKEAKMGPKRFCMLIFVFTCFHTFISFAAGDILGMPQRNAVGFMMAQQRDAFCDGVALPNSVLPWFDFLRSTDFCMKTLWLRHLVMLCLKILLSAVCFSLPIPAGVFMPVFMCGAISGRFFAEGASRLMIHLGWLPLPLDPRVFALVGAAAVCTGTLQVVSTAIIILELTNAGMTLVLPLTVACVVAYFVSNFFTSDLFSRTIVSRRLPAIIGVRELSFLEAHEAWHMKMKSVPAAQIMSTRFFKVFPSSTVFEVRTLLQEPWMVCALLSNEQDATLLGTISRRALADAVRNLPYDALYVPYLRQFAEKCRDPTWIYESGVDPAPFIVGLSTPFWRLQAFFQLLRVGQMWVVHRGRAVGIITKGNFLDFMFEYRDAHNTISWLLE
ncbi:Chloride channel protein F [Porphyridium purpureum]|uniref:Chloride channel protein F n=1 Tax=Porphyridium purpureum TaxID=35688 RepID=A0A5J4YSI4_PORPP|nr:Chloride channel protein F [Porphyridium purpureum]|eukprot:POR7518..scf236_6